MFPSTHVPAPEATLVLLDGSRLDTRHFQGRFTLVNFWATSCSSCVAEMPQLAATYRKYQARGFDTLAVAMQYDPPSYVVNFAQTHALPFKVAIDNTPAPSPRLWGRCGSRPPPPWWTSRAASSRNTWARPTLTACRP